MKKIRKLGVLTGGGDMVKVAKAVGTSFGQ